MAAVLATAASPSPLASDLWADERVDSSETRSSSSFIWSYLEAAATAIRQANFIVDVKGLVLIIIIILKFQYLFNELSFIQV